MLIFFQSKFYFAPAWLTESWRDECGNYKHCCYLNSLEYFVEMENGIVFSPRKNWRKLGGNFFDTVILLTSPILAAELQAKNVNVCIDLSLFSVGFSLLQPDYWRKYTLPFFKKLRRDCFVLQGFFSESQIPLKFILTSHFLQSWFTVHAFMLHNRIISPSICQRETFVHIVLMIFFFHSFSAIALWKPYVSRKLDLVT